MPDNFFCHNVDFFHLLCGFGFLLLSIISYRLDQKTGRRASTFWLVYFGIFSSAVEFLELFATAFSETRFIPLKFFLVAISCFSLFQFARDAFSDLRSRGPGAWIYFPVFAPPFYIAVSYSAEAALSVMAAEYLAAGFFASLALYLLFKKTRSSALKPLISYFFILLSVMALDIFTPVILLPDVLGLRAAFKNPVIPTAVLLFAVGFLTLFSLGRYYVSQRNISEKVLELIPRWNSKYFFLFVSTLIIFAGWLSTDFIEKNFKANESENLMKRARLVASSISDEGLRSLKWAAEDIQNVHYGYIKNMLIAFRSANNDCRFISIMGYRDGKVYFLADSEPSDSKDYSPPGQIYEEINEEDLSFFRERKNETLTGPAADRWGEWVSAFVPVPLFSEKKESIAVVMDLDAKNWRFAIAKRRLMPISIVALLLFLTLFFYTDRERQASRAARLVSFRRAQYEIISGSEADLNGAFEKITRITAATLNVERASVWMYNAERSSIICEKLYIKAGGTYERGLKLNACDFPSYFDAMQRQRNLIADDIRTHESFKEFAADYCGPLGITSMLDSPIWLHGKIIGVFCMEHVGYRRRWTDDEIAFASVVSDAAAIAVETSERAAAERIKLESDRKYKLLFDNSPLAIMYADEKGNVVDINNALTALLGPEAAGELKNTGVQSFPPFASDVSHRFKECSSALKEDSGGFEYIWKDGESLFLEYHIKPVKEADEKISMQVVIEDVTKKKRMESEMSKVSKLESLGILAGGIAHDFNNYLTAIVGNISYAKLMKGGQDGALCEVLDKAESISFDAKNLALQLLTFSKGNRPVKKNFHIIDTIRETVDFVLRGTNIDCSFAANEDAWPVEADEGQIKQAVTNVVVNAVQAMPGGGKIIVGIENLKNTVEDAAGLKRGNFVKISIKDTGSGINEKNISKIFDPYYTTKPHGSGLGLAVVFSIIKNHEGAVFAESDGVSGATFKIFLPAIPEALIERASSPNTASEVNLSGKVLLMDDEDEIRSITGQLLTHYGFQVESARNGEEAIELFAKAEKEGRPFDALVMDLTVPGGMGGAEALKKILEMDPAVKAIAASGYFSENTPELDYKHFGFKVFIPKPYKIKELCMVLKNIIAEE